MTVTYSNDVGSSSSWAFLKLLLRWKGSVYKLLWKDLIIFIVLFYCIHVVYLYLPDDKKDDFQAFVTYSKKYGTAIPLSFVLGFFVTTIMSRWLNQYNSIPFATGIAIYVSTSIHGYDEVGRCIRRTIVRYVCLSLTLVFRKISPSVKKRFANLDDLIEAGLLLENEAFEIEDLDRRYPDYGKTWLPTVWASNLIAKSRKEGRIYDDYAVFALNSALDDFRKKCKNLLAYNFVSIPLVYTQVVCIAVYTYFLLALVSQQNINSRETNVVGIVVLDTHPFLLVFQFIFYMGWLKVGEALMNPFGDDDDDFECSSLIDRNIHMSFLIVDEMHNNHPDLFKDKYWNDITAVDREDYSNISISFKSNSVPDSARISEIYQHVENVEQEQNIINAMLSKQEN